MKGVYEAMFIFKPDLTEDRLQAVMKEVVSLITTRGGAVIKEEPWGKRVLAYPIKKMKEGVYLLVEFELEKEKVAELRREYSLHGDILRTMILVPAGKE